MKDDIRAVKQELEQTKADLRTAHISLGAAQREVEALKARIDILTAANPDVEPVRRGRPPKAKTE